MFCTIKEMWLDFLIEWGIVRAQKPTEILADKIHVLAHRDKPKYRICHKYEFKKLDANTLSWSK